MPDVRGSDPRGYVWNRPKDSVSSAGAQISKGRQHYDSVVSMLRLETACRQELNLISMVKSVGSSDFSFQRGVKEENKNSKLHYQKIT